MVKKISVKLVERKAEEDYVELKAIRTMNLHKENVYTVYKYKNSHIKTFFFDCI